MKHEFVKRAIMCLLVLGSFKVCRWVEKGTSGYRFEIRETRKHPFVFGPVQWTYATEVVGAGFMDPGTTLLEFENRTLYKAKRYFQEDEPFVRDLKIDGNQIEWRDGGYQYILNVQRDDTKARPKPDSTSQSDQTPISEEATSDKQ